MFRRLIPLAVAVVLVLGCKKKTEDTGAGGDGAVVPSDPGAAYTIKVREEQKGDKSHVVRTSAGSFTVTEGGKTEGDKTEEKYDYTEEVLEMPAGADKPTKLRRVYKTAERSEKGGSLKAAAYASKTVVIEKKGEMYEATIDGKPADIGDAMTLTKEYQRADKPKMEDLLPKTPVKVNDSWTVEQEALKRFASSLDMNLDVGKSSITGKLTKAYTRGGVQWGVLEYKIDLTVLPEKPGKGPSGGGKLVGDMTLDTPIDGSSHQGSMKATMKATLNAPDGKGGQFVLDGKEEETRTPVK
jgi:hypothetical protein